MNRILGIFVLAVLIVFYLFFAWLIFDPSSNPTSTYLYLYLFGIPLIAFTLIALTRRDPVDFYLTVIIFMLPVLGMAIPPRKYQISFLTILSLGLALLILYKKYINKENIDLLPYKFALIPMVLLIPSVILSENIVISIRCYFIILGYYFLFIGFNQYLKIKGFPEKFLYGLIFSLLISSLMIYFEKISGISPSLSHHSQEVSSLLGVTIRRYSGIFQDPQKAAQFIAVLFVFFLTLVIRKSIKNHKMTILCIITLLLSLPALILTITRASIYSAVLVGVISLLFLNKFNLLGKIFLWLGIALITVILSSNSIDYLLPKSYTARIGKSQENLEGRFQIWEDTWYIFKAKPLSGIGLGAYRTYLIKTNPRMLHLAQIGLTKNVPTMPENGYLKILYETGIIGSLGITLVFFSILGTSLRLLLSRENIQKRSYIYASTMGGIVYLCSFITIFTAADSRNALLPVILLLLIVHSDQFVKNTLLPGSKNS